MTLDSAIVGKSLAGVVYEIHEWERQDARTGAVDPVSTAVILSWSDGAATRLAWSADVSCEGIRVGGPFPGDPTPDTRRLDVSARWGRLLGARVASVLEIKSSPIDGLPWSINLGFGSDGHMVVALGEFTPEGLMYMPDFLLVIASEEFARAYWPPAARSSAWGPG